MPHVGSERMTEVRRGLGPSRMGEQISEIDQQQQCNSISQRMASLKELIRRAKGLRALDTTQNSGKAAQECEWSHRLCTDVLPGDIGLRFMDEAVEIVNMTGIVWICQSRQCRSQGRRGCHFSALHSDFAQRNAEYHVWRMPNLQAGPNG